MNSFKGLHIFFLEHSFYPIVLSSALAIVLFFGRVLRSDSLVYRNLVWNLALAWVPYLASLWAASFYRLMPRFPWLLVFPGALWLAFFPNAPYIVTDFLHLQPRPGIPIWYDILLLATFAWTGLFLAIISLRTMHALIKQQTGWLIGWLFAGTALLLGGLGIYLGRFSRFNSWDLVLNPTDVLYDVAIRFVDPIRNLSFFGFTLLFSAFLWVVYLTVTSISHEATTDRNLPG
jgi:uncharacterized membrane protein